MLMLVTTCRTEQLLLHFPVCLTLHGQDRACHLLLSFEPGNAPLCHSKFCPCPHCPAASNPPSSAAALNPVAPETLGHLTRFLLTQLKPMLPIFGRGHFGGQQRTFPGLEPWSSMFLPRPADQSHQSLAAVPSPAAHHVGSARFLQNLVILWSFQSGSNALHVSSGFLIKSVVVTIIV